jgi:hypothetical protein
MNSWSISQRKDLQTRTSPGRPAYFLSLLVVIGIAISSGRCGAQVNPDKRVLTSVIGTTATNTAREFEADNIHLDVPFPELPVHAIMRAPVQTPRSFKRRWLTLDRLSITTLVAGEVIDSWGTYKNMTHTKWICGSSPAFAGGYDTNVPRQISSLRDVQAVCGVGEVGQSANWAFDVTQAGYFSEGGWVTKFHLASDRNYAAVEGWNLVNDVGWYMVARHLGKRSDWIGKCAPGLNFGRGIVHLNLGIGNFIALRHHRNPNTLDLYVPKDSNYSEPRWWGKN